MGELAHNWFLRLPENRNIYPAGFFRWLDTQEGMTIWKDFEAKAMQMAKIRPYYSAMAIAQVIRWESSLRDGGVEFKLNNNWIPGLSRLWMFNHCERYPYFFQLRSSLGRDET